MQLDVFNINRLQLVIESRFPLQNIFYRHPLPSREQTQSIDL